jgi:hypothetical protein
MSADSLRPSETDALSVLLPQGEEDSEKDLISMFFNKDIKLSQEKLFGVFGRFSGLCRKNQEQHVFKVIK